MYILYKPGPDLYIVVCLSQHNDTENRDLKLADMSISIYTISTVIDVAVYMSIRDIRGIMSVMIQNYKCYRHT